MTDDIPNQSGFFHRDILQPFPYQGIIEVFRNTENLAIDHSTKRAVFLNQIASSGVPSIQPANVFWDGRFFPAIHTDVGPSTVLTTILLPLS